MTCLFLLLDLQVLDVQIEGLQITTPEQNFTAASNAEMATIFKWIRFAVDGSLPVMR